MDTAIHLDQLTSTDKLCSQQGGFSSCSSVYVDGADIYEVNSEGIVVSTLQKQ
jgi:hypothetical protein